MLLKQLFKFGLIGSTSAVVHLTSVWLLVTYEHWHPLWANMLAFLIAYQVSFFGHHHWTFGHDKTHRQVSQAFGKFFMVALISFGLNQGLYALLLLVLHWQYLIALFVVLITVALVTFIVGKCWAFK